MDNGQSCILSFAPCPLAVLTIASLSWTFHHHYNLLSCSTAISSSQCMFPLFVVGHR